MHSIDLFDLEKETVFSTYATYWIRQAIVRYIENNSRTIRIPANLNQDLYLFQKIEENYYQRYERVPSDEYVIEQFNKMNLKDKFDIQTYRKLKLYSKELKSLDETLCTEDFDSDEELSSRISIDEDISVEDEVLANTNKEFFLNILNGSINISLTLQEKIVLNHVFGFENNQAKTLMETGKILGVTKERVRQIRIRALKKLADSEIFKETYLEYYNQEEFDIPKKINKLMRR